VRRDAVVTTPRASLDKQTWTRWLALGLLLLSAALVWHDLGAREVLGRDENLTLTKLDQPSLAAVLQVTRLKATGQPGNMQPLYFLVQHLFWPLVGRSAFLFRFLPSVFGLLTVAFTFKLGEALFGPWVGLVGALLTALLPLQVQYSQIARPYTLLALFSLSSAYFLVRGLQTRRFWFWAGFVLTATLNFYTHYNALFVLAAEGLFTAVVWLVELARLLTKKEPAERSVLLGPAISFLLVSLFCVPGLIRLAGLPWVGESSQVVAEWTLPFFRGFAYRSGLRNAGLQALILGLIVLGLIVLLWRRRWQASLFCLLWLAVPFVILSVMKSPRDFQERYVIFVPPLALLLAGQGLVASGAGLGRLVGGSRARWVAGLLVAMAALGLALFFVSPLRAYYAANRAEDRLDLTLGVLEDLVQPDDLILISPRFLVRPLAAEGAEIRYLTEHPTPAEFEALLTSQPRTWILYTSFLPALEVQEPLDRWIQARPDDFVRVQIKAITALAYHNQALTDPVMILQDRIDLLAQMAEVSANKQEAWLRHEALAVAYESLAGVYEARGETVLAAGCRDGAAEARAAAPPPW
jgi:hypothetical protein